jgi:hypothetical protein
MRYDGSERMVMKFEEVVLAVVLGGLVATVWAVLATAALQ